MNGQARSSKEKENRLKKIKEVLQREYEKKTKKAYKRGKQLVIKEFIEQKRKREQQVRRVVQLSEIVIVAEKIILGGLILSIEEANGLLISGFVLLGIAILMMEMIKQGGQVRKEVLFTLEECESELLELERE